MAKGKTRTRAAPRKTKPMGATDPGPARPSEPMGAPVEEALGLWARYARETGETVADFMRRFGEEQQKSYESWNAQLTESLRPKAPKTEADAARARFEEWNRQAEAIGKRIREAFETSLAPQRELFEQWAQPFLPDDATFAEKNREVVGLVQKLWSGMTVDLTRRLSESMLPEKGFDEFVQAQEAATKQFTENFQKLTQIYFTSPAFVTAFGKTLDNSLDLQKNMKDSEELFRRITGLPTRGEISELNQAVRDLSEQVSRLQGKHV